MLANQPEAGGCADRQLHLSPLLQNWRNLRLTIDTRLPDQGWGEPDIFIWLTAGVWQCDNVSSSEKATVTIQQLMTTQPNSFFWLIGGLVLLGLSLLAPEPTLVAMGFAGLIMALVSLSIVSLSKQLLVWGILSAAITLILRGMTPRHSQALQRTQYAQVNTLIPPGGVGKVSYEGVLWNACCKISDVAIAPGQMVNVVGRQGNTLFVTPIFPISDKTTG